MTRRVLGAGAVLGLLLVLVQFGSAAVLYVNPFQVATSTSVARNGQTVPLPLSSYGGPLSSYQFIEDVYQMKAVAHSGSSNSAPKYVSPHVFAYTMPNSTVKYAVQNQSGYTETLRKSTAEAGRREGSLIWTKEYIDLNGTMLIAKGPDQSDSYKGNKASVEINVTYDFDWWGRSARKVQIPIFRGTINLQGWANGKPIYYTTGNINRYLHISSITQEGNFYRLNFDNVKIPFNVLTKVGADYQLTTKFTTKVQNAGDGSGAEVNFLYNTPLVPMFATGSRPIPEPATMLLLLGGLPVIWGKMRRSK